jgi:hypothetical protein
VSAFPSPLRFHTIIIDEAHHPSVEINNLIAVLGVHDRRRHVNTLASTTGDSAKEAAAKVPCTTTPPLADVVFFVSATFDQTAVTRLQYLVPHRAWVQGALRHRHVQRHGSGSGGCTLRDGRFPVDVYSVADGSLSALRRSLLSSARQRRQHSAAAVALDSLTQLLPQGGGGGGRAGVTPTPRVLRAASRLAVELMTEQRTHDVIRSAEHAASSSSSALVFVPGIAEMMDFIAPLLHLSVGGAAGDDNSGDFHNFDHAIGTRSRRSSGPVGDLQRQLIAEGSIVLHVPRLGPLELVLLHSAVGGAGFAGGNRWATFGDRRGGGTFRPNAANNATMVGLTTTDAVEGFEVSKRAEPAHPPTDGAAPIPRLIVSTNIAESSLTLPDVRFVFDFGLERVVSASSAQKKDLALQPISYSSAIQRAGRVGRVAPGVVLWFGSGTPHATPMGRLALPAAVATSAGGKSTPGGAIQRGTFMAGAHIPTERMILSTLALPLPRAQGRTVFPLEELAASWFAQQPYGSVERNLRRLEAAGMVTRLTPTACSSESTEVSSQVNEQALLDVQCTDVGRFAAVMPMPLHVGRLLYTCMLFGVPIDGALLAAAAVWRGLGSLWNDNSPTGMASMRRLLAQDLNSIVNGCSKDTDCTAVGGQLWLARCALREWLLLPRASLTDSRAFATTFHSNRGGPMPKFVVHRGVAVTPQQQKWADANGILLENICALDLHVREIAEAALVYLRRGASDCESSTARYQWADEIDALSALTAILRGEANTTVSNRDGRHYASDAVFSVIPRIACTAQLTPPIKEGTTRAASDVSRPHSGGGLALSSLAFHRCSLAMASVFGGTAVLSAVPGRPQLWAVAQRHGMRVSTTLLVVVSLDAAVKSHPSAAWLDWQAIVCDAIAADLRPAIRGAVFLSQYSALLVDVAAELVAPQAQEVQLIGEGKSKPRRRHSSTDLGVAADRFGSVESRVRAALIDGGLRITARSWADAAARQRSDINVCDPAVEPAMSAQAGAPSAEPVIPRTPPSQHSVSNAPYPAAPTEGGGVDVLGTTDAEWVVVPIDPTVDIGPALEQMLLTAAAGNSDTAADMKLTFGGADKSSIKCVWIRRSAVEALNLAPMLHRMAAAAKFVFSADAFPKSASNIVTGRERTPTGASTGAGDIKHSATGSSVAQAEVTSKAFTSNDPTVPAELIVVVNSVLTNYLTTPEVALLGTSVPAPAAMSLHAATQPFVASRFLAQFAGETRRTPTGAVVGADAPINTGTVAPPTSSTSSSTPAMSVTAIGTAIGRRGPAGTGTGFGSPADAVRHMLRLEIPGRHVCSLCAVEVTDAGSLDRHLLTREHLRMLLQLVATRAPVKLSQVLLGPSGPIANPLLALAPQPARSVPGLSPVPYVATAASTKTDRAPLRMTLSVSDHSAEKFAYDPTADAAELHQSVTLDGAGVFTMGFATRLRVESEVPRVRHAGSGVVRSPATLPVRIDSPWLLPLPVAPAALEATTMTAHDVPAFGTAVVSALLAAAAFGHEVRLLVSRRGAGEDAAAGSARGEAAGRLADDDDILGFCVPGVHPAVVFPRSIRASPSWHRLLRGWTGAAPALHSMPELLGAGPRDGISSSRIAAGPLSLVNTTSTSITRMRRTLFEVENLIREAFTASTTASAARAGNDFRSEILWVGGGNVPTANASTSGASEPPPAPWHSPCGPWSAAQIELGFLMSLERTHEGTIGLHVLLRRWRHALLSMVPGDLVQAERSTLPVAIGGTAEGPMGSDGATPSASSSSTSSSISSSAFAALAAAAASTAPDAQQRLDRHFASERQVAAADAAAAQWIVNHKGYPTLGALLQEAVGATRIAPSWGLPFRGPDAGIDAYESFLLPPRPRVTLIVPRSASSVFPSKK